MIFVAASFSLLSLLVFRPLVRGGDRAEMLVESEFPSELEESDLASFEEDVPESTGSMVLGAAGAAAATGSEGPRSSPSCGGSFSAGSPSGEGSISAVVSSGAWTSSSCSASNLFRFSRGTPAEGVPFGS